MGVVLACLLVPWDVCSCRPCAPTFVFMRAPAEDTLSYCCRTAQVLREQVRQLQYSVRSAETRLAAAEKRTAQLEGENASLTIALRVSRPCT